MVRKGLVLFLLFASLVVARELEGFFSVENGYLTTDRGDRLPLSDSVTVYSKTGKELTVDSLKDARRVRVEFDQQGKVISIRVLSWWE